MGKNVKGVLGEKLGMTQVWDDANRVVPVTVIKAGPVRRHAGSLTRGRRLLGCAAWLRRN